MYNPEENEDCSWNMQNNNEQEFEIINLLKSVHLTVLHIILGMCFEIQKKLQK
jgi:hypothetical protein